MISELELTVLRATTENRGNVAGFALTDRVLIAVGGESNRQPTVLASSNAQQFETRKTPREHGLRDVLAVDTTIWTCGECGQLAVSRDHGASWTLLDTGIDGCLYALALGADGSVWCTGDNGYAARIVDDRAVRIDFATTTRLSNVYQVRDEMVVLGFDGKLRRWRNGTATEVGTGALRPLKALAITRMGTWVAVGDGGFIARSPDGSWFSRVKCDVDVDLEAIASLPDGRLVIVGDRGQVLVSSDDGRTWKSVRHDVGLVHLWSVERFGGGVLIGGDDGLIAKLAPIGDATWADRINVFGEANPLDAAFANGPVGFIDHGLDDFPAAPGTRAEQPLAGKHRVIAELAATPRAAWADLAWRWIDDGVAHRALLEELDRDGASSVSLIAALDELGDLHDDDREAAIARLARELTPELEAILVGSLVRDDQLAGVLTRAPTAGESLAPDDDEDDNDDRSPGQEAIDRALLPFYGSVEPLHFGTALPYAQGGHDPIHAISAYSRVDPVPHWHFITYGFTDLFTKETDGSEESGFGFELTFRLARPADQAQPPTWTLSFLQNLARYVFSTGNRFAPGHKMGLNGPIALDSDTRITAVCFTEDPELVEIDSEFGKARFVQIVGITDDEYRLIQEWSTPGLIEILRTRLPHLMTDLERPSVLDDPSTAREVETRVTAEGSSEDLTFAGEMKLSSDDGHVRIELGALYAAVLPRAMRGRLRHGRPYELRGRNAVLQLRPSSEIGYHLEEAGLVLDITQEVAREIEAQLREALVGTYRFENWPALEIIVTPSFIRGQDGTASDVRGIADPGDAARMVAEENARLAAESNDDVEDDQEDVADGGDRPMPDAERVIAALAMTERALRLAPDDHDIQFTHAMLLLDGERADLPGKGSELLTWLPRFRAPVRINVAVRLGKSAHALFGEVVDLAIGVAPSAAAFDDVPHALFAELGDAILHHAPRKLSGLVPLLPDDVTLLSRLAWKASQTEQREAALALYDRLVSLAIPAENDQRAIYLRGMNIACTQARVAKSYAAAARLAERVQPVAHENPDLFHSAACAYAALGDAPRALAQIKLALDHDYRHLDKLEADPDLGALLESPDFKTLIRDWHARGEGN